MNVLSGWKRIIALGYWMVVIPAEATFPWAAVGTTVEPVLVHWVIYIVGVALSAYGITAAMAKAMAAASTNPTEN